ncbi:cardiolipin synthase [Bacteroides graminisolvens]
MQGYAQERNDSIYTTDSLLNNQRSDSILVHFLQKIQIPITDTNEVKLLKSGEEKFLCLFSEIKKAKHHIHLEYFNFRNDSIANALFELLKVKAKEGVEIRLLFDAFGNWSNDKPLKQKHLDSISSYGIEITKFDPFRFPYLNHAFHRDHRKIAIIDGTIAYTGGMNVADYYIKGLPKIGSWRDMHIRIQGKAVKYLQDIFLEMWNETTKQQVKGAAYYPQFSGDTTIFDKSIAIVDRAPRIRSKEMRKTYAASIRSAQHCIQIVNPYFVPTHSIREALKDALARGVKVEIMISSKSDIPFTPEATFYLAHKLMKRGANIYLFNKGFHHSKIMMVDSLYCTVGSANLNSRSLRYDYETNAFIFSKQTTKELSDLFEKDKKGSILLTPQRWKERSNWNKFLGWFANLLTPFI